MCMKQGVRISLGKKLTILIVLFSMVLSLVAVAVSYRVFAGTMTEYYERLGTNLGRTVASRLEAEDLERYYRTGEEDENYKEIQDFIRELAVGNDIEYLYVVRPQGKGVVYLFDSDTRMNAGGRYEDGGHCDLGAYAELEGELAANLDRLLAGQPVDPIIQWDKNYGWLLTTFIPVLHEDGSMAGYVMTDISMDEVMDVRRTFLMVLCIPLALLTVSFIFLFLGVIRRKVIRPINLLARSAGAFVENHEKELAEGTAAVNVPAIQTGDEVEILADSFRKMEEDMISYIRSLVTVTAEKERIGAELNVAAQIQADMLPRSFPAFPDRREFDIYAMMDPAREVGGDFYDFFLVDPDHLAVVIADVSGKGVPAALFMVIARTLIKNHAQGGESPKDVFAQVNEQLCEGNDAGLFVTAWMGILEISTGQFVYANAGHNPPLLRRAGERFEWLRSHPGFVLAGMEGSRYQEYALTLAPGDTLYLYTDGVTEAVNAGQELFGEERLQEALNEEPGLPVRRLLPRIRGCIDAFAGEEEQVDDITMLGLYYAQKGERADG